MTNPEMLVSWKAKSSPPAARNSGAGKGTMVDPAHLRSRRAACKIVAVGLALWSALPARAADETAYEVFGQALAPIAAALLGSAGGPTQAMVAECLVNGGSGPLAAAAGTRLRLAVQAPDRFRIDLVREGSTTLFTACRNGKELWAVPAEPMTVLAQAAGFDTTDQAPDTTSPPLIPLALDPQMLSFLPLVFDVKDLGTEENPQRRVLQFGLLPQLREAIKAEEFTGRAWIGEDRRPTRLVVTTPQGELDLKIEKLDFAGELAASAWQPSEGQEALRLPASSLNGLFEKMLGAGAAVE